MSFARQLTDPILHSSFSSTVRPIFASRCEASLEGCTGANLTGKTSLNAMLIPYANRVYKGEYDFPQHQTNYLSPEGDNTTTSHGFLYNGRVMDVIDEEANDNFASLTLGVVFNGTDPGYPFTVSTNITYTIDENGFSLVVNAQNLHSR